MQFDPAFQTLTGHPPMRWQRRLFECFTAAEIPSALAIGLRLFEQIGNSMPASSRLMITKAERRFPARIRIGMPPEGLGRQLTEMTAWLDANCGAGNWAMTPAGVRGVVNDALALYFLDTALANAFVARWCLGYRAETYQGSFRLRQDEPTPRIAAPQHRTP